MPYNNKQTTNLMRVKQKRNNPINHPKTTRKQRSHKSASYPKYAKIIN
jgi:hypothetical protein